MAWTPWRKVADRLFWYTEHGLRMPVCYELGFAARTGLEEPEVVYVGAARSEAREMIAYGEGERPLSERIRAELDADRVLYWRATGARDLAHAEELAAARKSEGPHPWNDDG